MSGRQSSQVVGVEVGWPVGHVVDPLQLHVRVVVVRQPLLVDFCEVLVLVRFVFVVRVRLRLYSSLGRLHDPRFVFIIGLLLLVSVVVVEFFPHSRLEFQQLLLLFL